MTARRWRTDEYEPTPSQQLAGLPIFAPVETRTLARRGDPETSKRAAIAIADTLSELQQRVLAAFQAHGKMTAKEAEQLGEFEDLGFSTVRKRCSEGARDGWLRRTGVTRAGCDELEAVKREANL